MGTFYQPLGMPLRIGFANGIFWLLIVLFAVPAIFQWLWNITFPQLFRWPTLTYWQAFRIMIIVDLLFGVHRGF